MRNNIIESISVLSNSNWNTQMWLVKSLTQSKTPTLLYLTNSIFKIYKIIKMSSYSTQDIENKIKANLSDLHFIVS